MKAAILFLLTFLLGLPVTASDLGSSSLTSSEISSSYSPQVCQFSLTKYSGTIDSNGDTDYFQVGLSCPQKEDVRATVVVFINDEYVASKVVTVSAGKDYSGSTKIRVGSSYSGQKYKMLVE